MRKLIVAAAACLAVAAPMTAAPPAQAQSRTAVEASQRRVEAWLSQTIEWSNQYNQLLAKRIEILGQLNVGATQALQDFGNGGGDREWARAWAAQQRQELAELKTRLAELNRGPRPPLLVDGVDLNANRQTRPMADMIRTLPDDTLREIVSTEALALSVIDLVERTAARDQAAAGRLEQSVFDLNIMTLEVENTMSARNIAALTEDSPQTAVLQAGIHLNRAFIGALGVLKPNGARGPSERASVAMAIRREADLMDAQVVEIRARVRAFRAPPGMSASLLDKLNRVLAEYETTCRALTELSALMRQAAAIIEVRGEVDYDRLSAVIQATGEPFQRHLDADQRRRDILIGA